MEPATTPDTGPARFVSSTLIIRDDECTVEFLASSFSIAEYAGVAPIAVHRSGGTINTVTVNVFTRDGTATNNGDYASNYLSVTFVGDTYIADTNGGGGTILIPGETDKTVFIPILDDVIGEGNETFTALLTNLAGPVLK